MASTQTLTTSFMVEMFKAIHDFTPSTGDTFKLALYSSSASLDADTTAYTATGEVTGTNYTAGGATLTTVTPASGTPIGGGIGAYTNFSALTFSTVTLTARYALIYNSTKANRSVCVLDFGSDKTKTAADFVITFPASDVDSALLRFVRQG